MAIFGWLADQPTFGDNAERPFSTNEQFCGIEASGRLSCSSTRLDYFAGWEYDRLCGNDSETGHCEGEAELTALRNHSALAVPYLTAFARLKVD